MGQFEEAYSKMTDGELLALYVERDALVPEAQSALLAELEKRSLTETDAAALVQRPSASQNALQPEPTRGKKTVEGESPDADADNVPPPEAEVVYASSAASEVERVLAQLESHGFEVILRKGDYLGGTSQLFGGMHLLVAADRADDARGIIAEVQPETSVDGAPESSAESLAKYRIFWRRFLAGWIDGLVLSFTVDKIDNWFISAWLPIAYEVAMLTAWGQTIGKMICKIKVLDVSECPITFKHAFKRNIVIIVLNLTLTVSLLKSGDDASSGVAELILFFAFTWFMLELITMLTNKKRRAIHDFIGGTVVCKSFD